MGAAGIFLSDCIKANLFLYFKGHRMFVAAAVGTDSPFHQINIETILKQTKLCVINFLNYTVVFNCVHLWSLVFIPDVSGSCASPSDLHEVVSEELYEVYPPCYLKTEVFHWTTHLLGFVERPVSFMSRSTSAFSVFLLCCSTAFSALDVFCFSFFDIRFARLNIFLV